MKIFNKENGLEKVYVQYSDLLLLYNLNTIIPDTIYDKVYSDNFKVDDSNRFDFVEFNRKEEIDFFKNIDWILDYNSLNRKTPYELNRYYVNSINDISDYIHSTEYINNDDFNYQYDILNHKALSIKDFYFTKFGSLEMTFPQVPNYDKVIIDDTVNTGQIITEGFIPNTIVIYKANGDSFVGSDNVYTKLINTAIEMKTKKDPDYYKDAFNYTSHFSLSDDCKFLIVKYRNRKYLSNDDLLLKKKKYKVKSIIKKFINKVNNKL